MKPHPTWGLINSDATDIQDFRGFIVHTMVQIAAHKRDTNVHSKDTVSYITETCPLTQDVVSTLCINSTAFIDFWPLVGCQTVNLNMLSIYEVSMANMF